MVLSSNQTIGASLFADDLRLKHLLTESFLKAQLNQDLAVFISIQFSALPIQ